MASGIDKAVVTDAKFSVSIDSMDPANVPAVLEENKLKF